MSSYQQVNVQCHSGFREILMAELAAVGFDSFQETDTGFTTFLEETASLSSLKEIITRYQESAAATYNVEDVDKINWNKKWEESYDPIIIDDRCIVRASFHDPRPEFPIEIIVTPKMSFGTGHHETTFLMMKAQLDIDHQHKNILDAGCGTGILSILAGKLGAGSILAYDNDEWVIDNVQENFEINKIKGKVLHGTVQELSKQGGFSVKFDIMLANINKNILLGDIPWYAGLLATNGELLLSGFYTEDLPDLERIAGKAGLKLVGTDTKNNWCMARFRWE